MNVKKIMGTVLLVVGIAVLILFVIADKIGIGENPIFGPTQITGTVVGAVLAIIGLILLLRKGQPVSNG